LSIIFTPALEHKKPPLKLNQGDLLCRGKPQTRTYRRGSRLRISCHTCLSPPLLSHTTCTRAESPITHPGRRLRLKCDGTRAETRFHLSAKRTSLFKSAGTSVQSTTGSRGVRIGGSNAGYTMFRGSVKGTGYPLHSRVSPSLPLPCVTVCHHVSTGLYLLNRPLANQ
jgi:hypothetical protein